MINCKFYCDRQNNKIKNYFIQSMCFCIVFCSLEFHLEYSVVTRCQTVPKPMARARVDFYALGDGGRAGVAPICGNREACPADLARDP